MQYVGSVKGREHALMLAKDIKKKEKCLVVLEKAKNNVGHVIYRGWIDRKYKGKPKVIWHSEWKAKYKRA